VPYVRERWFDGESFPEDLREIQAMAARWCRDVAGIRVHGTTRCVPREVYETQEKARMQPAPTTVFDVPRWTKAKVHPDHHTQVSRALYSLPTAYIGRTLEVRVDSMTVRFYLGAALVKAHPRVSPGQRSTDQTDYPTSKAPWALRSVDALRAAAAKQGQHVGLFVSRLLEGPVPWTRMRQGYGLMRLCERYGAARVDALCARAIAFDVIDTRRIERMLKMAQQSETMAESTGKLISLPGRFARDTASFQTRATSTNTPRGFKDDGGVS
jgi:hypothetical protein